MTSQAGLLKIIFERVKKFIKRYRLLLNFLRLSYEVYNEIRKKIIRLWMRKSHIELACVKGDQIGRFYTLRNIFPIVYNKLKNYDVSQFTTSFWENHNIALEKALLPYPPFSFLKNPIINRTMFVTAGGKWLREELTFLEEKIPSNKLKTLLEEDYVGDPLLLNTTYLTSHNSIHHLYHLIRFSDRTKCDINHIDTIVEWGGGYGNMAKIFIRLKSNFCTYNIIDTPLFSCIQWLYLATVFGKERVHLLWNPEETIHADKINLIPLCFMEHQKIQADLFISTWALSESSEISLNYVLSHSWFDSKHFLLAYHEGSFNDSCKLEDFVFSDEEIKESIEFLSGHHYYTFL